MRYMGNKWFLKNFGYGTVRKEIGVGTHL